VRAKDLYGNKSVEGTSSAHMIKNPQNPTRSLSKSSTKRIPHLLRRKRTIKGNYLTMARSTLFKGVSGCQVEVE
jgi:hypothetical protein